MVPSVLVRAEPASPLPETTMAPWLPRFREVRRALLGCTLLCQATLVAISPAQAQEASEDCDNMCMAARALIERFDLREAPFAARDLEGWAPPRKVVTVLPGATEVLRTAIGDAEIVAVSDTSEAPSVIAGADVYIGRCTPEVIRLGTDLKWIQIDRAGAETCSDIPAVAERGIVVTNLQRILSPAIADHALAMMLALQRTLPRYTMDRADHQWSHRISYPDHDELVESEEKTMLVVGLGGIGTEIARKANGLGMRVTATRNSSRDGPDFVEYVGLAHELLELAAEADVVVNATPLTSETVGMFDAAFFEAMQETAYFINIGRGESLVTDDLVAALEAGSIAGAGLDVTDPEPLPADHPLWTMPQVVMTPHIAGISDGGHSRRAGVLIVENLRRYVAGDPLLSMVDLARGY